MVEHLVGQGCDGNSPEVHNIVPMLVLPTLSETAKAKAAYLYSQGYRE